MNIVLSPGQITLVGLASLFVSWLASLLIEKVLPKVWAAIFKKPVQTVDLGKWTKTVLVGVFAFVFGWWWYPTTLPPLPVFSGTFTTMWAQFWAWIPLLLAALSPYVGSSMGIYNLMMSYVLDPTKRKAIYAWILRYLASQTGIILMTPVDPPPPPPIPPVSSPPS